MYLYLIVFIVLLPKPIDSLLVLVYLLQTLPRPDDVRLAVGIGQTLDRCDLFAQNRVQRRIAGLHRLVINQHHACAALLQAAAKAGPQEWATFLWRRERPVARLASLPP